MTLIRRRLSKASFRLSPPPHTHQLRRASFDATAVKFVRDRGLDHAVERERNLRPLINLKDLLKSEPSKSLPISVISQQKESLRIPTRPIDFVRKYPSVFDEFTPGGVSVHPHVKLKDEVLELDADEQLIYQSDSYKKDAADRVLKLLMISRSNKIPLTLLDQLIWDLGLPRDFARSVAPHFPDYFRVVGNRDIGSGSYRSDKVENLELVCWSNEHAVSAVEKKRTPVVFPLNYSKGFEMDKKFKKWVDEWQKLPYASPYEDSSNLGPLTDESDKWAVAVLHELLNLFVSKKTEKDNVLSIGDYLGIRSRFKRALLNHPGIFYLSRKIETYTVVLKEAFRRGSLIDEHPIMVMRNRYIHLMHATKEEQKIVSGHSSGNKRQEQKTSGSIGQAVGKDEGGEDDDEQSLTGSEFEDEEEDDVVDVDESDVDESDVDEDDQNIRSGACRNASSRRGRTDRGRDSNMRRQPRRQYSEGEKDVSTRWSSRQERNQESRSDDKSRRWSSPEQSRRYSKGEKDVSTRWSSRQERNQQSRSDDKSRRWSSPEQSRQYSEGKKDVLTRWSSRQERSQESRSDDKPRRWSSTEQFRRNRKGEKDDMKRWSSQQNSRRGDEPRSRKHESRSDDKPQRWSSPEQSRSRQESRRSDKPRTSPVGRSNGTSGYRSKHSS